MNRSPVERSSAHLPVFVAGARHWTIGDLYSVQRELLPESCAATDASTDLAEDAIEEAITEFRYRHDLVSAEECDSWLALRGLEYADLHDCIRRRGLGIPGRSEREAEIDFLLGDQFPELALSVAWRVAMAMELQLPQPTGTQPAVAHWQEWQARFTSVLSRLLSPEARLRCMSRLRRELTQFHFISAEFDTVNAALEAQWCVNEDRLALVSVAASHGYPHRIQSRFIDELPADWALALSGCALGTASAPLSVDGRYLLLSALRRIEPTLANAEVLARIDSAIVAQHFDALASKHLRWIINLSHG